MGGGLKKVCSASLLGLIFFLGWRSTPGISPAANHPTSHLVR
jgi:hypothetical protein